MSYDCIIGCDLLNLPTVILIKRGQNINIQLTESTQTVNTTSEVEMNNIQKVENWTPCEDLIVQYKNSNYAVVILNTPISFSFNQQFVLNLWNQGDMDSLPKDVLNYFHKGSTKVIITPDQDETDYTKALKELNIYCSTQNLDIDIIYVLVDTCGRFDQIMANVNTLFKSKHIFESVKIFQIASSSLTWLLSRGYHSISIPVNLRKNQEWCSLLPIGAPCIVTSTGLKWNLGKQEIFNYFTFLHIIS
ncbi:hypothetical protein NQ314_019113 [Rhamnusium bicolor]|uniref:Thiamine diphosphokinase n=1 Tax=Rhamnusium bicolor TaxID=1586634 RepID=A0AAV8WNZ0_9CUCU|nr:hypothetical protein NQ314_019113 [Rhamnusium bicolor]